MHLRAHYGLLIKTHGVSNQKTLTNASWKPKSSRGGESHKTCQEHVALNKNVCITVMRI